ncbi:hypothetical protein FB45DRAFT_867746 [Roridomyces roridus]|uniref:Uncharacterized protein n=1 Tax=Roridomyces roridus TaxID=1738132 RepID=A0AAD7FMJ5_9AGAR|nr:hypothetical protein FB45DRAFT_867746 [Roridomyces roridus]
MALKAETDTTEQVLGCQTTNSSIHPIFSPTEISTPLNIRFGMGIEFYGREERRISKLPEISHVLRNQIILWVADPELKAKVRGMIVLTTTYLPDVKTTEPITIIEDQVVQVDLRSHERPETDTRFSSEGRDTASSVAIGLFDKREQKRRAQRLISSFRVAKRPPALVDVPLHEYVARGWDVTNQQWRNTTWPRLDADFADAGLSSSSARWNLTLDCSRAAEISRNEDKPGEDTEIHACPTGGALD